MPQQPPTIFGVTRRGWQEPYVAPFDQIELDPMEMDVELEMGAEGSLEGLMRFLTQSAPILGGAIGGLVANVPGAALGGLTGQGVRTLVEQRQGQRSAETTPPLDLLAELLGAGALQGGLEGAGGLVAKGLRAGGHAVYRGYLKPSLAERMLPRARRTVDTLIREGLTVSRAGQAKIAKLKAGVWQAIEEVIQAAPPNARLSIQAIGKQIRTFAKQRYGGLGSDPADYAAALGVAKKFEEHPETFVTLSSGQPARVTKISIPLAEQVKIATHRRIGDKAWGMERTPVVQAEKAQAAALRRGIAKAVPAVGPLNRRYGSLAEAQVALGHAVEREASTQKVYGMRNIVSVLGGAEEGFRQSSPAAGIATTLALRVGLSPKIATRAAIIADRLGRRGAIPANAARVAVLAAIQGLDAGDLADVDVPP